MHPVTPTIFPQARQGLTPFCVMADMNELHTLPNVARWVADAETVLEGLLTKEPALCEK